MTHTHTTKQYKQNKKKEEEIRDSSPLAFFCFRLPLLMASLCFVLLFVTFLFMYEPLCVRVLVSALDHCTRIEHEIVFSVPVQLTFFLFCFSLRCSTFFAVK